MAPAAVMHVEVAVAAYKIVIFLVTAKWVGSAHVGAVIGNAQHGSVGQGVALCDAPDLEAGAHTLQRAAGRGRIGVSISAINRVSVKSIAYDGGMVGAVCYIV